MSNSAITGPILVDTSRAPAGTAAAPSFAFSDSMGTGAYLVSPGVLGLSTNGVRRVVVDASGNVGIGASATAGKVNANSSRITISGTNASTNGGEFIAAGANATISLASGGLASYVWTAENYPMVFGTNGAERMRIDPSGNVGIGLTQGNPTAKLDVQGTSNPSLKVWSRAGTTGNYAELQLHSYNTFSGFGQTYIRAINTNSGNSGTVLAFGTEDNGFGGPIERMRINADGTITIGSGGASANNVVFNLIGGAVRPSGDGNVNFGLSANRWATIFATNGTINTSDERLKKNIKPLDSTLDKVMQLKPSSWEAKYETYYVGNSGFVAQELEQVFPQLVQTQPETIEGHENIKTVGVAGPEMMAIMVKAIQEQQAQIEALKAEVAALKAP